MVCWRLSCISGGRVQRSPVCGSLRTHQGLHAMLDSVALVMHLGALRQQTLATLSAAASQQGAPVLRRHACAESELTLAATLGRLIGSFAHILYG